MGRRKKVPDSHHLTKRQIEVFNYIKYHVEKYNYPPSIRDICKAIGLKSTSSVFAYINDLQQAGLLKKDPAHPRALEITTKEYQIQKRHKPIYIPVIDALSTEEDNIIDYFPVYKELFDEDVNDIVVIQVDDSKVENVYDDDYTFVNLHPSEYTTDDVVIVRANSYVTAEQYNSGIVEANLVGKIIGLVRIGIGCERR